MWKRRKIKEKKKIRPLQSPDFQFVSSITQVIPFLETERSRKFHGIFENHGVPPALLPGLLKGSP